MHLTILGATGRVGFHLTSLALEQGHRVTAVMRDASRLSLMHPSLQILAGDVLNPEFIEKALEGSDVVISALGDRNLHGKISLMSDAMQITVRVMKTKNIKRLIAVAGAGILQFDSNSLQRGQPDFPPFLMNVSEDHLRVWKIFEASKLDWTLVCPPQIVADKFNPTFSVLADYPPAPGRQVWAGTLAGFILQEMSENKFLCKRVGITN